MVSEALDFGQPTLTPKLCHAAIQVLENKYSITYFYWVMLKVLQYKYSIENFDNVELIS